MVKLLAKYSGLEIGSIVKLTEEKERKLIEKGFAVKYEEMEQEYIDLSQEDEKEEEVKERKMITLSFEDGTTETLEVYTTKELEKLGAEGQKEIISKIGEDPESEDFSNQIKRIAFINTTYGHLRKCSRFRDKNG